MRSGEHSAEAAHVQQRPNEKDRGPNTTASHPSACPCLNCGRACISGIGFAQPPPHRSPETRTPKLGDQLAFHYSFRRTKANNNKVSSN